MREMVTAAVAAIALSGLGLSGTAWAQEPVTIVTTTPNRQERFLGLEVFGGGGQFQIELAPATETEDARYPKWGWDAGATLSYGIRWLGITGAVSHQAIGESLSAYHLVVGPRVTSPWIVGDRGAARFYAHALGGFAQTSGVTPSQRSAEWVFGGGMDAFFFRMQFDYVRLNLNGVEKGNARVFLGAVVPLCLRACSESKDVFNVSGHPAAR